MSDLRASWRGVLTIAATYVAFLLFAQFGFLRQVQREVVDAGRVRFVMGAMGIAGLAASLGTAWLLGRVSEPGGPRLIRAGLGAVAAVAMASVFCHGFAALTIVAAATGGSIGLLTVAVAASLPEIVPRRWMGLAAGLGTGLAYFVSNVPALFEAAPEVRALFPAVLALVALILSPGRIEPEPAEADPEINTPRILQLLAIFLVLIWLDSAAFAVVQATPALKAQTWGSEAQKLVQGIVHLMAAVGAGAMLDAGVFVAIPLAAWGLFAVAFPLLQAGGGTTANIAGPLYAIGISLYSTALVVAPSRGSSPAPRWRAGLLFGVAGWLGSALGVGMAQDLGRIPAWFLVVTGAALALATLGPQLRLFAPALAFGTLGLFAAAFEPAGPAGSAEARGRLVYIQEGCIHCHSQYVRPDARDVAWWGPARSIDRGERPPLIGTRRQGPDLAQIGNRRGEVWQEIHLRDPRRLNPGSRMPSYAYLFDGDGQRGRDLVAYLMSLGAATAVERWTLTGREAVPSAAGSPERGRVLFGEYCAVCHGADGRGDGPLAPKLNDPKADLRKGRFAAIRPGAEPEEAALARIVRHGLPPTAMPGHEWLTDRQVADLVAFVQTFEKEPR